MSDTQKNETVATEQPHSLAISRMDTRFFSMCSPLPSHGRRTPAAAIPLAHTYPLS